MSFSEFGCQLLRAIQRLNRAILMHHTTLSLSRYAVVKICACWLLLFLKQLNGKSVSSPSVAVIYNTECAFEIKDCEWLICCTCLSTSHHAYSAEYCSVAIFIAWLKIWENQLHCTTVSVIACTIEIAMRMCTYQCPNT